MLPCVVVKWERGKLLVRQMGREDEWFVVVKNDMKGKTNVKI